MSHLINCLIALWQGLLGLQRQSPEWYRDRLREELVEQHEARTFVEKLSETADVYYAIHRSNHDGHPVQEVPAFRPAVHALPYLYMVGKYSSRWGFYRVAAWWCGAGRGRVREVVNPSKDSKLREVALRHRIDPSRFQRVCRRLLRVWPLLP